MQIEITDTTVAGVVLNKVSFDLINESPTLENIIRQRVVSEVMAYNKTLGEIFYGLVQPINSVNLSNGYKMNEAKNINAKKQVFMAVEGFKNNNYIVLINDKQMVDLNEEVSVNSETKIQFIKLTPLYGQD